jgi:hypothetical protein
MFQHDAVFIVNKLFKRAAKVEKIYEMAKENALAVIYILIISILYF